MEKTIQEKAYAKINLTLGVTGKRSDGYHTLDSLMVTTSLYDDVKVEKDRDIIVTCTGMILPYRNTIRKAAELYQSLTGRGARIHVYKHIPAEAGLGGGSADAAAVLRAMNRMYDELDRETLLQIALRVGADVPFCFMGGFCRAQGIGEVLEPLNMKEKLHLVLVKPEKGVSTKELFAGLQLPCPQPANSLVMAASARGDLETLSGLLVNSLEEPAIDCVPEIGILREELIKNGAMSARMTGSGSAVFGIFKDEEAASRAEQVIRLHPACAFSCTATTV